MFATMRRRLLAYVVLAVLSLSLIAEAQRTGTISVDESEWLTSSQIAWQLLRTGASPAQWEHAFDAHRLGDWGHKNPPLGKYLVGFAAARHIPDGEIQDYQVGFIEDGSARRHERQRLPPLPVLSAGRTVIALCASASLWGVYAIASELLSGSAWAVLAALCLFLVPSFQQHAVRVYMDMPQLALLTAAGYALVRHARTGRLALAWLSALLAGLACAVKLSAGAFCVGACVYSLIATLRREQRVSAFIASVVAPCVSFVAVNPYLYPAPLTRSLAIMQAWSTSKALQQRDARIADGAIHDLADKLRLVSARGVFAPTSAPGLHSLALDALRVSWPALVLLAAVGCSAAWLTGLRAQLRVTRRELTVQLAACGLGLVCEWLLSGHITCYGAASALGMCALTRAGTPAARAFACTAISTWLMTSWWLPFDWSRYYLPLLCASAVSYALGIDALASCARVSDVVSPHPLVRSVALGVTAFVGLALGCVWLAIVTPPLLPLR